MQSFVKQLRLLIWTLQSLFKRYIKEIFAAFVLGIILFSSIRFMAPIAKKTLFADIKVIAVVGSYEPSNLPVFIQQKISLGLTSLSSDGKAVPSLAVSWESDTDGKRYFFNLKKNVHWHSAEEFTAYDVNYRFKDVLVTASDRYQVKIELSDPFAPLPTLLTKPIFKSGLMGVGEYMVSYLKLKEGNVSELILKPFTKDNSKPILDYRFYANPDDALTAFKLGEIDMLQNLTNKGAFSDEKNVDIEETVLTDRYLAVFYNLKHDELKKRELRQGLNYAIPKIEGKTSFSPIAETSWAYNDKVRRYTTDDKLAASLFKKAEVASDSAIAIATFPDYLDIAEKIAEAWNSLGLATDVKVVRAFPPDYDVFIGVQEIPPDPDQYSFWHSTQGATNITHYNNPKIDRLLEEGRKAQNKEERLKIYLDFQKFFLEDPPVAFLIHPVVYTITRK